MEHPEATAAAPARETTQATPADTGVIAKLKAWRAEHDGTVTTSLPETEIGVSYPSFIGHDEVMAATKMAGKNRSRTGLMLVAKLCKFEGERLTHGEITKYLPNSDVVHLINLLLDEDEGGEAEDTGN